MYPRLTNNFIYTRFCRYALAIAMALTLGGIMARGQSPSSVTLTWNADTDLSTAGYMIYSGTVSGVYTQQTDVGNVTTTTISNLPTANVTYFAVAAYDASGLESPPSTEINIVSDADGSVLTWSAFPTYTVNAATVAGTSVSGTSVTFSASVDPNGTTGPVTDPANVYVSWQYGVTAGNYTQTSAAQPIGTGTVPVPVSTAITTAGLAATIFHYQLVISSTLGNMYGPDQTFSLEAPTVAYAPTEGTGNAVSVTVNPNGLDTTVTIQYGTTTAYTSGTISMDVGNGSSAVTINQDLTGVTPNTIYHYQVVTTNALGTFYGPDETFIEAQVGTSAMLETGQASPGIPGGTFRSLGNPTTNSQQHEAFQATVDGNKASGIIGTNNSGIWADVGTTGLNLIVRTGSGAPGYAGAASGGTFASLTDPVYADDDNVAFIGKLVTTGTVWSGNATGIWETTGGALQMVARVGDPAPDLNGTTWNGCPVFSSFPQFVLPDQGGVIVLANLQSGVGGVSNSDNQGIWAVGMDGVFRRIVGKGDAISVNGTMKTIGSLAIFNVPSASAGQTRHFSGAGNLVYRVTFTDDSSSFVQSVLP